MAATALAAELGLPLFVVRLDGLITRYLGDSLSKLRLIFDAVNQTRAVYLFDEFDSIGYARDHGSDVGEMRRVLNSFLMFIERLSSNSLVIAATNHGQRLDKALYRRFDDLIEFGLPTEAEIRAIFKARLNGVKTERLAACRARRAASKREDGAGGKNRRGASAKGRFARSVRCPMPWDPCDVALRGGVLTLRPGLRLRGRVA